MKATAACCGFAERRNWQNWEESWSMKSHMLTTVIQRSIMYWPWIMPRKSSPSTNVCGECVMTCFIEKYSWFLILSMGMFNKYFIVPVLCSFKYILNTLWCTSRLFRVLSLSADGVHLIIGVHSFCIHFSASVFLLLSWEKLAVGKLSSLTSCRSFKCQMSWIFRLW